MQLLRRITYNWSPIKFMKVALGLLTLLGGLDLNNPTLTVAGAVLLAWGLFSKQACCTIRQPKRRSYSNQEKIGNEK